MPPESPSPPALHSCRRWQNCESHGDAPPCVPQTSHGGALRDVGAASIADFSARHEAGSAKATGTSRNPNAETSKPLRRNTIESVLSDDHSGRRLATQDSEHYSRPFSAEHVGGRRRGHRRRRTNPALQPIRTGERRKSKWPPYRRSGNTGASILACLTVVCDNSHPAKIEAMYTFHHWTHWIDSWHSTAGVCLFSRHAGDRSRENEALRRRVPSTEFGRSTRMYMRLM